MQKMKKICPIDSDRCILFSVFQLQNIDNYCHNSGHVEFLKILNLGLCRIIIGRFHPNIKKIHLIDSGLRMPDGQTDAWMHGRGESYNPLKFSIENCRGAKPAEYPLLTGLELNVVKKIVICNCCNVYLPRLRLSWFSERNNL